MGARRGDTRERIQQVALELFAEHGYEKTSLREIAEQLNITRPALYYHFKTKEDILDGVVTDLVARVDELIEWAVTRPATPAARRETLRSVSELLGGRWRPVIRFSQVNQGVMSELPVAGALQQRMIRLVSLFVDPADDPAQRFQARLAVLAVVLGSLPAAPLLSDDDVTDQQRRDIGLDVALRLLSGS